MKNFIVLLALFSTMFTAKSFSREIDELSVNPESGTLVLVHGFMRSKMNIRVNTEGKLK